MFVKYGVDSLKINLSRESITACRATAASSPRRDRDLRREAKAWQAVARRMPARATRSSCVATASR
jgi:hypothetical protein